MCGSYQAGRNLFGFNQKNKAKKQVSLYHRQEALNSMMQMKVFAKLGKSE